MTSNPVWTYGYDATGNRPEKGTRAVKLIQRPVQEGEAASLRIDSTSIDIVSRSVRRRRARRPRVAHFGKHATYQYDGFGDVTQRVSPDTGNTNATFDADSNTSTRTDARGVEAMAYYDAVDRVTAINYPTSSLDVTFTYDSTQSGCNMTTQIFGKGHPTAVLDASGHTQLCYDRFGRMAHSSETINGGITLTTTYTYNVGGHLTQVKTPQSTLINYTYDGLGRINGVSYQLSGQSSATTVVSNVTYYPFGPVAAITYADGRVLTRTYDQDYVISAVADPGTGGLNLSFGRDLLGNLTQVSNGTTGNNLIYDGLNRLTTVNDLSNNPVAAYTYDTTGNRLTKTVGTGPVQDYGYPTTSHQLTSISTISPFTNITRAYDAAGNTTAIGSTLGFVFDNTGRMSQLNNGSGAALMSYKTDATGKRVEKYLTGNTALTKYTAYDPEGHVLGDYDTSSNRIDETLWMGNLPVAVLTGTSGTLSYLEPDQLGTPRVAVDGTSNLPTWQWSPVNDPFGESAPTNLNGSTLVVNLRLPGQENDAESGLSYNYFRDYDPNTGRYTESDPLGLAAGVSTYAYVGGNPLSFTDPLGLLRWVGDITYGTITVGAHHIGLYSYERVQLNLTACQDGKKISIHLISDANHGPGLDLPSTAFFGHVTINDSQTEVTDDSGRNLEGLLNLQSQSGPGIHTSGTISVGNGNGTGTFTASGEIVEGVNYSGQAQLGPYSNTAVPSGH